MAAAELIASIFDLKIYIWRINRDSGLLAGNHVQSLIQIFGSGSNIVNLGNYHLSHFVLLTDGNGKNDNLPPLPGLPIANANAAGAIGPEERAAQFNREALEAIRIADEHDARKRGVRAH